jgi:hypothetical protein
MSLPHFEVATGVIDGVNKTFKVSMPYLPGTLAVFLNGQLKVGGYMDGWVESAPTLGEFTMNTAPEPGPVGGDVVQAFYIDSASVVPGTEVTPIFGVISTAPDEIFGQLAAPTGIVGEVEGLSGLFGRTDEVVSARSEVEELSEISGQLELC